MTQESRRLLVTAATELFTERGYRQTTFEDIAKRSGVSRGSIPWHFGNKEGLLAAVVDHAVADFRADADTLDAGTLDEAMHALEAFTRGPSTQLFVTLIAEAMEPGSALRKWYADLHEALRAQIRAWLAQADLPADVDADDLGTVLLGAVMGIHQQWRVNPDAIDLDRTFATVGVLLRMAGVGAPR